LLDTGPAPRQAPPSMNILRSRKAPLLAAALAALAGTALRGADEDALRAHAAALQARIFTIDTHVDTPTLMLRRPDWDPADLHDPVTDFSQCDFPRMRRGGLKAAFWVVYVPQSPGGLTPEGRAGARDRALRMFVRTREALAHHPDLCRLALTADDGPAIAATGRRAIYLSMENGYSIGQDLTLLSTYRDLGARLFGITHVLNDDLGDSASDAQGPRWHGLSPLGRRAVAECNRLGLVIDGSHASDETIDQILDLSRAPILLSHSGCRDVHEHPRNLGDRLIRKLASKGGVIQVITLSSYLVSSLPNPALNRARAQLMARMSSRGRSAAAEAEFATEYRRLEAKYPPSRGSIDDYMRHLVHAIEVAGADHVGIGSDMDGGGGLDGLVDVGDYGRITLELLKRGYSDTDIEKIWGLNTLRVIRTAQSLAEHR
jgi:membrane dipeptidase